MKKEPVFGIADIDHIIRYGFEIAIEMNYCTSDHISLLHKCDEYIEMLKEEHREEIGNCIWDEPFFDRCNHLQDKIKRLLDEHEGK